MYLRSMFVTISMIALITLEVSAETAIQNDWSGGPDVNGPVFEWNTEFWDSYNINWSSVPGILKLMYKFDENIIDRAFAGAAFVYSEDVDGDRDMDVLGSAWGVDEVAWWENVDGSGTSWIKHSVDDNLNGTSCVYAEDVDDDGDMDVLASADAGNEIAWYENLDGAGLTWMKHSVDPGFGGAHFVYSGDVDGDGDTDILGAAYGDSDITWWENTNGSGTAWAEYTIESEFGQASAVFAKDVDDDGDLDVLGAARSDDDITWWENLDGSGTSWAEHLIDGAFDGAIHVYAEDVDKDGDIDVLGAALNANEISWWENEDGYGTSWTKHIVSVDFVGAHSVVPADLDHDGDFDLACAAFSTGKTCWWENTDGNGTSWQEHILREDLSYSRCVYCEDIDGDGAVEVLGAAAGADIILYWDNIGPARSGSLESSILNTDTQPLWDYITWSSYGPIGTLVSFQVRASDNYTNMGAWSDTLTSPCVLTGILTDGDKYVQYRAILNTFNPDTTPILKNITITWDPLGVEDDPQVTEYLLLGAEPNPSSESVSIGFAVPGNSLVELSIFDLAGRLVIAPPQGEYSPGIHKIQLGGLTPGIYFCRMRSGDFSAIQRFAIID